MLNIIGSPDFIVCKSSNVVIVGFNMNNILLCEVFIHDALDIGTTGNE